MKSVMLYKAAPLRLLMRVFAFVGLLVLCGCASTRETQQPTEPPETVVTMRIAAATVTASEHAETQSALAGVCGDFNKLGIRQDRFAPGDIVVGPATLFADKPANLELAGALQLSPSLFAQWGIDVTAGRSIQIPAQIELVSTGKEKWQPTGRVLYFADARQLQDAASCRVRLGSP